MTQMESTVESTDVYVSEGYSQAQADTVSVPSGCTVQWQSANSENITRVIYLARVLPSQVADRGSASKICCRRQLADSPDFLSLLCSYLRANSTPIMPVLAATIARESFILR